MISTLPHRPYVGVTGFQTTEEVNDALRVFQKNPLQSHVLMCGMIAEPSLITGEKRQSERSVTTIDQLSGLIAAAVLALPVIHYEISDCENSFSEDLVVLLHHLQKQGLPLAVQLNGTPAPEEVRSLRTHFPGIILLYQIRPELLRQGAKAVVEEIKRHEKKSFRYVLIDPSCGTGKDFLLNDVLPIADALHVKIPELQIGFAGGFDGTNALPRINALQGALGSTNFSIDAEGKLFTGNILDTEKVDAYVEAAVQGFQP